MKTALIVVDGDLSFKLYSLNSFLYYFKNNIKKIIQKNKKNNIKKQT